MKLYVQRFIHRINGLPDFSSLKFTKYNQYESFELPLGQMATCLSARGERFPDLLRWH
jgi:myosin-crossreactive antigen